MMIGYEKKLAVAYLCAGLGNLIRDGTIDAHQAQNAVVGAGFNMHDVKEHASEQDREALIFGYGAPRMIHVNESNQEMN